jgi:hypothetical protein
VWKLPLLLLPVSSSFASLCASLKLMYNFSVIDTPLCGFVNIPEQFIADHSFIFYIKVRDVIIFAGRVTDPRY